MHPLIYYIASLTPHTSGTIPRGLQTGVFSTLDLSFNELTGEFTGGGSFNDVTKKHMFLTLEVNRLSGQLRTSVESVHKLNILKGNIFSCGFVPTKDEYSGSYVCGSSALDGSIYTLVVVGASALILLLAGPLLLLHFPNQSIRVSFSRHFVWMKSIASKWISAIEYMQEVSVQRRLAGNGLTAIILYDRFLQWTWRVDASITIIGILGCLPIYVLKGANSGGANMDYSTHSHMYSYLLSVAFVSGMAPATVLMTTWIIAVCFLTWQLLGRRQVSTNSLPSIPISNSEKSTADNYAHIKKWQSDTGVVVGAKIATVLFINMLIVVTFNGLYVYSTLFEFSTASKLSIQIAIAIFKYLYSFVIVPAVILAPVKDLPSVLWIKISVLLINSVFVPCLVTAVTEPLCYQASNITSMQSCI
jgi:hypothetical protein